MSVQEIIIEQGEFDKYKREEDKILDEFSKDPFSLTYFMSINELINLIKPLSDKEGKGIKVLYSIFNQKEQINRKSIREIIKKNFDINDSTTHHHLQEFLNSGFFRINRKSIKVSVYGQIFFNELDFLKKNLKDIGEIRAVLSFLGTFFNLINNNKRIFIIEAISNEPLAFSDLLIRINIMRFLSEMEYKKTSTSIVSYHLKKLINEEIIRKKEKHYRLTETGYIFYKFLNIILLKITETKLKRDKPLLSKTIEEIGYHKNVEYIRLGNLKPTLIKTCIKNPIIISENNKYLGIFGRSACIKAFAKGFSFSSIGLKKIFLESIIKIPPIDINEPFFQILLTISKYNTWNIPISRDNKIIGKFEFEKVFMGGVWQNIESSFHSDRLSLFQFE